MSKHPECEKTLNLILLVIIIRGKQNPTGYIKICKEILHA